MDVGKGDGEGYGIGVCVGYGDGRGGFCVWGWESERGKEEMGLEEYESG